MHILFLSHYFPPETNAPASRTFEHCREWVRTGHRVTVVTCAPNHPRGVVYQGYRNRLWSTERVAGITVIRLWTYVASNNGFLLRTVNYISFMVACIVATPFLPRPEIVVSTSPQFFNGLAGFFLARMKRRPWILEIRDLWPDSIVAVGAVRSPLIIGFVRYLEGFAYRHANAIVALTDAFAKHISARGIANNKITVIKNGANLDLFKMQPRDPMLEDELGLSGKFVAAYFGTHGMAHRLETILEAAALTRARKDILWLMVGDGAERDRLMRLKAEMGLENLVTLAQQPRERMPAFWSIADASLVLLRRSEVFKTVIPSKIFESFAMGKPVVIGVEGESRDLVEAAHGGLAIVPEDAVELAQAVVRLHETPGLAAAMGADGKAYVERHFDRTVLARRFLDVMAAVYGAAIYEPASQVQVRSSRGE